MFVLHGCGSARSTFLDILAAFCVGFFGVCLIPTQLEGPFRWSALVVGHRKVGRRGPSAMFNSHCMMCSERSNI